jgi:hypothetical protein
MARPVADTSPAKISGAAIAPLIAALRRRNLHFDRCCEVRHEVFVGALDTEDGDEGADAGGHRAGDCDRRQVVEPAVERARGVGVQRDPDAHAGRERSHIRLVHCRAHAHDRRVDHL